MQAQLAQSDLDRNLSVCLHVHAFQLSMYEYEYEHEHGEMHLYLEDAAGFLCRGMRFKIAVTSITRAKHFWVKTL